MGLSGNETGYRCRSLFGCTIQQEDEVFKHIVQLADQVGLVDFPFGISESDAQFVELADQTGFGGNWGQAFLHEFELHFEELQLLLYGANSFVNCLTADLSLPGDLTEVLLLGTKLLRQRKLTLGEEASVGLKKGGDTNAFCVNGLAAAARRHSCHFL
jgi:hypothetical protein